MKISPKKLVAYVIGAPILAGGFLVLAPFLLVYLLGQTIWWGIENTTSKEYIKWGGDDRYVGW